MRSARRSHATAAGILTAAGVRTLYGRPVLGLPVIPAQETVARVLARAHRAVHTTAAAVICSRDIVEVPGDTGQEPESLTLDSGSDASHLAAQIRAAVRRGGATVKLAVDPREPLQSSPSGDPLGDPWLEDHSAVVDRIRAAGSVVVLAGPGVVRARAIPGLHALADKLGAGVLNTWGAKGLYHWRSQHHWATVGLQHDDFRLAGLDRADLIVLTGLDEREAPPSAWSWRPHVVVSPEALGPLSELVPARPMALEMPPLRALLAALTQAGWESSASPLAPSRVTLHYSGCLSGGGLVAADAGGPGFWTARTFATTEPRTALVPPEARPGWAVACVAVARLVDPLRPALAVVEGELDEVTTLVIDFATARGLTVGIEIWSAEGDRLAAEVHSDRLGGLVEPTTGGGVACLATDQAQIEDFIELAGPVVAWRP